MRIQKTWSTVLFKLKENESAAVRFMKRLTFCFYKINCYCKKFCIFNRWWVLTNTYNLYIDKS